MRIGEQRGQADERVPRLVAGCDPCALSLTPAQGYLLSRIDGATPWKLLRAIGGLPAGEVDRLLEAWLGAGVIEVEGEQGPGAGASREAGPVASEASRASAAEAQDATQEAPAADFEAGAAQAAPQSVAGVSVDEGLGLDVEVQRRILAFAARLERPYHEILGVAVDADARAIKKAYFAHSRVVHPDRYFRRDIGPFEPLVERCFKKLLEAYELLSDPATRAEVQREAAQQQSAAPRAEPSAEPGAEDARSGPAAGAASAAPGAGPPQRARDAARRMRLRALRGAGASPAPGLAERRRKAKSFFEAGMAAFRAERWTEAAGAVRLAMAFDPTNPSFREPFVEVQRRAHQERAAQLVARAERALELHDAREALPLLEEAAQFRPGDTELHLRAATLAWQLAGQDGEELKRARRLAAAACEVEPERADLRLLLGRIYKQAGLVANARRELEAALSLEPRSAEAKAELKSL